MDTAVKLNDISKDIFYLVSGYVRSKINILLNDKVIPQELIELCIVFYFVMESFAVSEDVAISNGGMTVTPVSYTHLTLPTIGCV